MSDYFDEGFMAPFTSDTMPETMPCTSETRLPDDAPEDADSDDACDEAWDDTSDDGLGAITDELVPEDAPEAVPDELLWVELMSFPLQAVVSSAAASNAPNPNAIFFSIGYAPFSAARFFGRMASSATAPQRWIAIAVLV